jgi:outer membrane protein OmpA-like peptidoglycan-associated protein
MGWAVARAGVVGHAGRGSASKVQSVGTAANVFVLACTLLGSTGLQALAQSTQRDVLIGVSKIGRPGVAQLYSVEHDSIGMYESANALVQRGEVASGQRQLEQLVARYPDSESADRARRDLATIYRAGKPVAPLAAGQVSYLGRPEVVPPAPEPAINPWRTSIRPAMPYEKTAQDKLRATAGDLVFFGEGSAELGARARKALSGQADWLKQHADRTVVIEGHADDQGSPAELRALSTARAEAVRARLIAEGVDGARIRVVGHAAQRRVALCPDQSCAGQNRRAATVIGGPSAVAVSPR